MKTLKGPAIFLAQFMADEEPFNSIESMARWAADLGFVGIQVPIGNPAFIDVAVAAESRDYCDELKGRVEDCGVVITELSTHLEGQLVAVHPAYDKLFDGFAPEAVRGNPAARTAPVILRISTVNIADIRNSFRERRSMLMRGERLSFRARRALASGRNRR